MANSPTAIDTLNAEMAAVVAALDRAREPSARSNAENVFRRALVVAIGSYFEARLLEVIEEFCATRSTKNVELCSFVKNKALLRQYHTFFDWNASNVNKFLSLFGNEIQRRFGEKIIKNTDLKVAVEQFIFLGKLRNGVAHDFGSLQFDLTRDDLLRSYQAASLFVEEFATEIGV